MLTARARSITFPLATVAILVLAGCGDTDEPSGQQSAPASSPTVATDPPEPASALPCSPTPDRGSGRPVECPTEVESRPGQVLVETSLGSFSIRLDVKRAPFTTTSFRHLGDRGFFDQLSFHRIAPGFVIQGGDPAGNGSGGPGYSVVEPPPSGLTYERGVVAMAKTEAEPAGTSGSQFFVVSGSAAQLPPEYALVGEISGGFDTIKRIESKGGGRGTDGLPKTPVVIEKMTVEGP